LFMNNFHKEGEAKWEIKRELNHCWIRLKHFG
jgi:hypothetical protein